jgi:hypothetical protein
MWQTAPPRLPIPSPLLSPGTHVRFAPS